MPDERLLAPIRRFWTPLEVEVAYKAIFSAFHSRLEKVTVIISKATEGDSATGEVVIAEGDYLRWMDALEARLNEVADAEAGTSAEAPGTDHVNFAQRYLST
jgi:hypothetical protein